MYTTENKNTSGRSWIVIAMILAVFHLPAIVSAQLGFERFKSENTIATYDNVLNFAKVGENDVAKQLNEELLGTAKTRHKRLSDQRRAELETLMALSKMTEKLVNVIRGGRHLDLTKSENRLQGK
ncbi:uncharacterized protein LOC117609217 isoform X2 [Osmia lignaria lignaria]|uniref:uncharacterized protein LOC117609217 isoform X2 n=1 Tax=Osmia lignaria lignaria TaxID=1437193 RepID=UPI00147887B0|nr:uncharacterized protein LOC117609217 isoform X2 [Osmia lignaria]